MLIPMLTAAFVAPAYADEATVIDVSVGTSVIRAESRPVSRVLLSDNTLAELRLLEEGQYQIRGLSVGTTDLYVWYRGDEGRPRMYKVIVTNDLSDVARRITEAAPGSSLHVYPVRDRLVVEGYVDDLETLEKVAAVAKVYDEKFVNLVAVRGDQQVQLKVIFAEVSRSGTRELGLNITGNSANYYGGMQGPKRTTTAYGAWTPDDQYPQLNYNAAFSPSGEAFNLMGMITGGVNLAAVLSVLEQYNLARTLAEPTLVSLSGQQAEFLAGGEVPIPVGATGNKITIEFKEYGVKLVFVPTVMSGKVIDMQVYVEVSEVDPNTSISLLGIEIPGFIARKGKTHLRIEDGMTFAMAGLLDERTTATRAQIPILGDIPIIGAAFRYVKHDRDEKELVIFVTPSLVRPLAATEVPPPPGVTENYNPNDFELFLMGNLTAAGSRTVQPTGSYGLTR